MTLPQPLLEVPFIRPGQWLKLSPLGGQIYWRCMVHGLLKVMCYRVFCAGDCVGHCSRLMRFATAHHIYFQARKTNPPAFAGGC